MFGRQNRSWGCSPLLGCGVGGPVTGDKKRPPGGALTSDGGRRTLARNDFFWPTGAQRRSMGRLCLPAAQRRWLSIVGPTTVGIEWRRLGRKDRAHDGSDANRRQRDEEGKLRCAASLLHGGGYPLVWSAPEPGSATTSAPLAADSVRVHELLEATSGPRHIPPGARRPKLRNRVGTEGLILGEDIRLVNWRAPRPGILNVDQSNIG
jgi:hypothetical protein